MDHMGNKNYEYCHNWSYHVDDQCKRRRSVQPTTNQAHNETVMTSKTRDKRSLSYTCSGYGEYHIDSRNNLEVFCDFSRCPGGNIISSIRWERELNLRQGWYSPYDDPDCSISRLGTYKSLLRVRNYRPRRHDGVYRCRAEMMFFQGMGDL